jgi:hypothetical protein
VDTRIVCVPVIDGDPIEPCAEISCNVPGDVASESSEIGHLGGVFGRGYATAAKGLATQTSALPAAVCVAYAPATRA